MSLPVTSDSLPVTSTLRVSVVIPTHNPRADYLARVVEALRQQTLPREQWELLVVDNNSQPSLRASTRQTAEGIREEGEVAEGVCQEAVSPSLGSVEQYFGMAVAPKRVESEIGEQRSDAMQGDLKLTNLKHNTPELELGWHPNARVVREEKLGLTFTRLRGFAEAQGELAVMVDDDNLLGPDYLETAVRISQEHPTLGAFGGKCFPEFEVEPEPWLASVSSGLGLRDLGEAPQLFPEETGERGVSVGQCLPSAAPHAVSQTRLSEAVGKPELLKNRTTVLPKNRVTRRVTEFPDCAPIGAGMVLRREAAAAYAERLQARGARQGAQGKETITDRKGDSLASGGDNDICLTVLEEGWQVGYLPQLELTHLIPKRRMTLDYQKRMAREAMRSFILMLDQHGIRPWGAIPRWSVPLRIAKDYLRVQPWRSPERLLKWCMNRGRYEACAALPRGGERGKSGYRH